jgi:carbamoyl-phosphate synthase large subunit
LCLEIFVLKNEFRNVLLTSAGRRSYLVRYFREALGGAGKVICANAYPDTPAMCVADETAVVPFSYHPEYLPTLLEICRKYEIGLLCSMHDLDTFILSRHVKKLKSVGVTPVLPDEQWGQICLDKYECTRRLEATGLNTPWTSVSLPEALEAISREELQLPVLLKARLGFGSLGLRVCYSVDDLQLQYETSVKHLKSHQLDRFFPLPADQSILIQQFLSGQEYCVDVVNDLQGRYACHFACKVHTMRAGETDTVTTVDAAFAGDMPKRLSAATSHTGPWGLDVFDDDGVLRITDINPRFTGDYPFHHLAGADIPAALIAWAKGQEPDPDWLKAEVGVRGYKDLLPKRIESPRR